MDYKEAHQYIYEMAEESFKQIFNKSPSFDWLYDFAEPYYNDWCVSGDLPSEEDIDRDVTDYAEMVCP